MKIALNPIPNHPTCPICRSPVHPNDIEKASAKSKAPQDVKIRFCKCKKREPKIISNAVAELQYTIPLKIISKEQMLANVKEPQDVIPQMFSSKCYEMFANYIDSCPEPVRDDLKALSNNNCQWDEFSRFSLYSKILSVANDNKFQVKEKEACF